MAVRVTVVSKFRTLILPCAYLWIRFFLACTADAQLNMLKSLGIGAKNLPLLPLPPTVIQRSAMTSDDGIGASTSTINVLGNCTTVIYALPKEDHLVVGYINEWINAYSFIMSKYIISRTLLSADNHCYQQQRRLLPESNTTVCSTNEVSKKHFFLFLLLHSSL